MSDEKEQPLFLITHHLSLITSVVADGSDAGERVSRRAIKREGASRLARSALGVTLYKGDGLYLRRLAVNWESDRAGNRQGPGLRLSESDAAQALYPFRRGQCG